jgi:hypothetical protein
VYGAEGGEPEGYVLWVPDRKLLVLVNRKATLPPNSLLVGCSGKRRKAGLAVAGKHGEGLKAAAAVLMREKCHLELHQSQLALAFKASSSGALCSFVRKVHTATEEEPRVLQIGLLLRMLKLELQVSRRSDVITIVSGLPEFVALDNYFLLRSHQAVCHRSQLTQPRQYLRLLAGDRGALLWPAAPATGSSLASESVVKRVFVAGIFWEQKSSQKHYGVDFSATVSNNRDRTNIHHPTYQEHMAQIVDHLLKKGSEDVVELLLPVLLLELGQAEEDSHHLHRLPEFITPPAYARLLAAFKRQLVPPQRFLCPRTEEERKALEHCATKDHFYVTSPLLYKLFTTRGDFPDLATMQRASWQALRAGRPVRPGTALADAERKLREEARLVLEISLEQAGRLELRDTQGGHVLDCKWSKGDGKLLVASSRLPYELGGKWKLLKAIRSQVEAMKKSLREIDTPAHSLTARAEPAQTTSAPSALIPSTSFSSPDPRSSSSSTSSSHGKNIPGEQAHNNVDDEEEDVGIEDDDIGKEDEEDDVDQEVIKLREKMAIEHQETDEDEVEEAGVDPTTNSGNEPTTTETATFSDHAPLPEGTDGGDWTEALTGGQAPAARNAPRDGHCAALTDRTLRVQYRPLDDDDQVVDCTERGFERLRKAPKPQLVETLAGIRAIVNALGHPVAPAVCCVEYEFEAVFAAQSSSYSANLWPLLHRAYTRRELFAYLVVLLSHEVAHLCVPQAGHGEKHGRMTEDLVARALLKSDLAWTRESLAPGIATPPLAR